MTPRRRPTPPPWTSPATSTSPTACYHSVSAANNYLTGKLQGLESDNGWGTNTTVTYTGGYWNATGAPGWSVPTAGPHRAATHQFPAYNPPCTAVMVTATETGTADLLRRDRNVSRTAIAAVTPEDGFSIGTYLASGYQHQLAAVRRPERHLERAGPEANVTAVGYQGLANTYVSVSQLIAASGGVLTTNNVLTPSLQPQTWYSLLDAAVGNQEGALNCGATPTPSACSAYSALTTLGSFTGSCRESSAISSPSTSSCSSGSVSDNGLTPTSTCCRLLTTEAELANGPTH